MIPGVAATRRAAVRRGIAVAAFAFAGSAVIACPICFREMALTPVQQLAAADRVVIAQADASGGPWPVVEVVKGSPQPGEVASVAQAVAPGPVLLVRPVPNASWIVVGPVRRERADLLRRVASSAPTATASDAEWSAHLTLLLPYLDDADPVTASMAYGEFARAPYAAMRSLKPALDPSRYLAGIDDPTRQAVDTLLLGIAGGATGSTLVEQRMDVAWRNRDATNLAALIAADLELKGPSRLPAIQARYFADRQRSLAEIEAALLALSVHGDADGTVPREQVIRAFVAFIQLRKPMAALVADHLAEWEYWDAVPAYVQLLKSNAIADPASRMAVLKYLAQSPRADAKAAVRLIPVSGR